MTVNDWLEISQMSGTGNAEVTLTASSYEELVERTATLKVKGVSTDALISIKQNAFIPTISISERTFFVSSVGETLTITILSNANWSIDNSVLPEWITINDASGEANVSKTLDIIVSDNIGDLREATIPIFMTNNPTVILGEVKITQDIFSAEGYVELVYETDNDNETIDLFDGYGSYMYDIFHNTVSSVISDIIIEGKRIIIDGTDRFLFENSGEHIVYVLFNNNEINENSFGGYKSFNGVVTEYYPAYPFRHNANLKRVRIPSNVTSAIDNGLFYGCERLKEIVIDSENCFGRHFAENAINLEDVKLNFQVSNIPDFAFSGCTNLSNDFAINYIHKKEGLRIGYGAFQGCSKISGVNNVLDLSCCEDIGTLSFENCASIDEVYVPYSFDNTGDPFQNTGKTIHLTSPNNICLFESNFKKVVCHTLLNDTYRLFAGLNESISTVIEEIEFLSEEQQTLSRKTVYGNPHLKKLIFHSQLPPIISQTTFKGIRYGGTLVYPEGADYSQLLSTDAYYLGFYGWNGITPPPRTNLIYYKTSNSYSASYNNTGSRGYDNSLVYAISNGKKTEDGYLKLEFEDYIKVLGGYFTENTVIELVIPEGVEEVGDLFPYDIFNMDKIVYPSTVEVITGLSGISAKEIHFGRGLKTITDRFQYGADKMYFHSLNPPTIPSNFIWGTPTVYVPKESYDKYNVDEFKGNFENGLTLLPME